MASKPKSASASAEPTKEMQALQSDLARVTTELQETKTQLSKALETPQTQAGPSQEAQTLEVQTLRASQAQLTKELQNTKAQLIEALQTPASTTEPSNIHTELKKLRAEKTQEIWNLQEINAQLTKELQEAKAHTASGSKASSEPTESKENPELAKEVQILRANEWKLTQELQEMKEQLTQAQTPSPASSESPKELHALQASHDKLAQELKEALAQIALGVPSSQDANDSSSSETQVLKDKLKNAELQIRLLEGEMSKLYEDINILENRPVKEESLASSSSHVE